MANLSSYALTANLPTRTSNLYNDSGYITIANLNIFFQEDKEVILEVGFGMGEHFIEQFLSLIIDIIYFLIIRVCYIILFI
jgi:hypothetical protein